MQIEARFEESLEAKTDATVNKQSAIVGALKSRAGIGLVLLVVWLISIGYMASRLKVGWVPHDEGTLGLNAERVLQGQLPHRDFDDYTGGLTFVHALAFRIFGISSASMRYVLFAFFVPWVPALFYIASRFSSPIAAGAVTLLAVAWSVPNYPGPMPSWYNLYFATWGVAALMRYLESESKWWLFAAGLCGGISMLAKIAAAYYVAGVLLFFVFREQCLSRKRETGAQESSRVYSAVVILGLFAFVALLFRMIRSRPGIGGPVYFAVPALILSILLVARELRGITGSAEHRFRLLAAMCVPFVTGLLLPTLVFVIKFAQAGAAREMLRGVAGTPARAIQHASFDPHHPLTMIALLPFALAIVIAYECKTAGRLACGVVIALYGGLLLSLAGTSVLAYYLGWCALGTAIPLLTVAGTRLLWNNQSQGDVSDIRQQRVMLLLSVTVLCSLIQFPFSAPLYFFYVAPLVILCVFGLMTLTNRPPAFVFGVLLVIYLIFPALPVTAYRMGISHDPAGENLRLDMHRAGGLRVDPFDAPTYNALIPLIEAHVKGEFIYAAPDSPEVYFLSGQKSFSRHYFEYAEIEERADYAGWVTEKVERLGVNEAVIKSDPRFSTKLPADLLARLKELYPHSNEIGNFEFFWK